MAVEYGQKIAASAVIDNAIALASGTNNINGSSLDLGANTDPQSVVVRLQVTIVNEIGVPTDGYDVDIRVQNSEDNSNWPDNQHGQPMGNFADATVGGDLTLSEWMEFAPKCRYVRLQTDNNNGTDALVFTSRMAKITMQGK